MFIASLSKKDFRSSGATCSHRAPTERSVVLRRRLYTFCSYGANHVFAPEEQHLLAPEEQHLLAPEEQHLFAPEEQHVYSFSVKKIFAPAERHVHIALLRSAALFYDEGYIHFAPTEQPMSLLRRSKPRLCACS